MYNIINILSDIRRDTRYQKLFKKNLLLCNNLSNLSAKKMEKRLSDKTINDPNHPDTWTDEFAAEYFDEMFKDELIEFEKNIEKFKDKTIFDIDTPGNEYFSNKFHMLYNRLNLILSPAEKRELKFRIVLAGVLFFISIVIMHDVLTYIRTLDKVVRMIFETYSNELIEPYILLALAYSDRPNKEELQKNIYQMALNRNFQIIFVLTELSIFMTVVSREFSEYAMITTQRKIQKELIPKIDQCILFLAKEQEITSKSLYACMTMIYPKIKYELLIKLYDKYFKDITTYIVDMNLQNRIYNSVQINFASIWDKLMKKHIGERQ